MMHTLMSLDKVKSACKEPPHQRTHFQCFFGLLRGQSAPKWAQNGLISPVGAPQQPFLGHKAVEHIQTAKRRETVGTLHMRLDFPVSTSSLRPSNSMICPGRGPKRPPEAPNANSHKPRIGHIFAYMAKNAIPRAPTPPATPHFLWLPPLKIAQTDV